MTRPINDALPEDSIRDFVGQNASYYRAQFRRIGDAQSYVPSFNPAAALLGSVWFGMRNLWALFTVFLILETVAVVQFVRGLSGDLGGPLRQRVEMIEQTLEIRRQQLAAAIEKSADNVDSFRRTIASLEGSIDDIRQQADAADGQAAVLMTTAVALILGIKLVQGLLANPALMRRYVAWRSRPTRLGGHGGPSLVSAVLLCLLTYVACATEFSFPGRIGFLQQFPVDPAIPATAAAWVKDWLGSAATGSAWFFDALVVAIRGVLDTLETIFVKTPWPVMAGFTILLTVLSAGARAGTLTAAALAYLGFLGFWEKSMQTLALLGTAACISISLGIPLGILCARKPKVYMVVRPVLDFMQTMPGFVYLIPIIAFFGTGKPAAIVATMIFGSSPVVRLTVLGLRGVPHSVREAAMAFGASPRYLLWKIDLPLAMPSIMAGINQTILLSLAMVVIASLIGAQGLGQDVLEALQYASEGQGILAGVAILFCAMILDRIVQGRRR
ncbi:ABC transporter permease subunit [Salipiger sp. P9]|uniref:ABC transporter permease n=1 Tax=Salipiger pentaromativorans TaxID=2943193 RepID=UPI002157445C|nr:ABC transporter permease subunit [Salipiger pentaromativorans]MCR8549158.1 ABC transporter permease subunit [Salipiger pentaromativorans]